jgi:uroporphyrinogen decarboxylase
VPRLRKQLEPLKQAGIKVAYHSDGDITEIIDGLIDAGVDAINPIEPTSGMDLGALKKRYGRNLVFIGNVDANVMTMGNPAGVQREVRRCIREAAGGGGLFIDTGAGELMPWFPLDNILAMCRAVQDFGRYPLSI